MQSKYDSVDRDEEMNRLTSILTKTYDNQNIKYSLEPPKQTNMAGFSALTVSYRINNSDGFEAIGTTNIVCIVCIVFI
jgi:hypothetical protein